MFLFGRWACLLRMATPRMTSNFPPMTVCSLRYRTDVALCLCIIWLILAKMDLLTCLCIIWLIMCWLVFALFIDQGWICWGKGPCRVRYVCYGWGADLCFEGYWWKELTYILPICFVVCYDHFSKLSFCFVQEMCLIDSCETSGVDGFLLVYLLLCCPVTSLETSISILGYLSFIFTIIVCTLYNYSMQSAILLKTWFFWCQKLPG